MQRVCPAPWRKRPSRHVSARESRCTRGRCHLSGTVLSSLPHRCTPVRGDGRPFEDLLGCSCPFGIQVAEGLDLGAFNVGESLHCAGTSHAQAYEAHTHCLHGFGGQPEYGFLSFDAGRYLKTIFRPGCHTEWSCRSAGRCRRMRPCRAQLSLRLPNV